LKKTSNTDSTAMLKDCEANILLPQVPISPYNAFSSMI